MKAGVCFVHTVERHIHTDRVISDCLEIIHEFKTSRKILNLRVWRREGEREGNVLMTANLTWCKGLVALGSEKRVEEATPKAVRNGQMDVWKRWQPVSRREGTQ